jgi:hypothetical protein
MEVSCKGIIAAVLTRNRGRCQEGNCTCATKPVAIGRGHPYCAQSISVWKSWQPPSQKADLQCYGDEKGREEVGHLVDGEAGHAVEEQTGVAIFFRVPVWFPLLYEPDDEDNRGAQDETIVSVQRERVVLACAVRDHAGDLHPMVR